MSILRRLNRRILVEDDEPGNSIEIICKGDGTIAILAHTDGVQRLRLDLDIFQGDTLQRNLDKLRGTNPGGV